MKPFTTSTIDEQGKTTLPMQVEGIAREELASSLVGSRIFSLSVPVQQSLEQAWFAQLLLSNNRGLEITSSSTEVGGWVEYGTINVEVSSPPVSVSKEVKEVGFDDFLIASIQILIADERGFQIEAGLVIESNDSREIMFVASDIPGSFSVLLPGGTGRLDPQFPLSQYHRSPLC